MRDNSSSVNLARGTLFACLILVCAGPSRGAADRVVWKPVAGAMLRIDDRPAKTWNVFQARKKDHLVLVQLGRRFLMLDSRAKEMYELDPDKLERKSKDLLWHETNKPAQPMATSDWMVRDAGPVRRIRATISSEGRVVEVEVPIQQDLRKFY